MLYKHVRSRKGYLPLWGRWTWEGSVVEDQLWMRRGPLWTRYSVRSLQLFGSVWRTPGDLDPSDHPLYLGPGPTQQPTPAAGVRKIAHIRFKKKKKDTTKGLERRRKHSNLSLFKQACFNPAFNRVERSYTVSRHKGEFKNTMCFPLAPLRKCQAFTWLTYHIST